MDWKTALRLVLPLVIQAKAPKLAPLTPILVSTAEDVEDIFHGKGAEKLSHVVDAGVDAAELVNASKGRVVIDPAQMHTDGAQAVSLAVDIVNMITKAKAPHEG